MEPALTETWGRALPGGRLGAIRFLVRPTPAPYFALRTRWAILPRDGLKVPLLEWGLP